jgi:hypothetical protein
METRGEYQQVIRRTYVNKRRDKIGCAPVGKICRSTKLKVRISFLDNGNSETSPSLKRRKGRKSH